MMVANFRQISSSMPGSSRAESLSPGAFLDGSHGPQQQAELKRPGAGTEPVAADQAGDRDVILARGETLMLGDGQPKSHDPGDDFTTEHRILPRVSSGVRQPAAQQQVV